MNLNSLEIGTQTSTCYSHECQKILPLIPSLIYFPLPVFKHHFCIVYMNTWHHVNVYLN